VAEPCDTLNVILQKIDEIICNLQTQINYLTNQVTNITNQVININGDIINIYNTLGECCSVTTTSTSTTTRICENFSLSNTGDDPVAIIITDCTTQEQEAIVLLPGDTNICVVTDSPLTVPGTVIVTPNGPCVPATTTTTSSSTTSTTSTSSTTTTTTTAIPCECLTFSNSDSVSHSISYEDCTGTLVSGLLINAYETIKVCGCCGLATSELVTITVGANCIDEECPVPITTTTTTTSPSCNCFDAKLVVSSETLASTDDKQVTVLYNDCFGNPYINTYDSPNIYSLGCVDYSVGITVIGLIDDIEQILYLPIGTGVPCCDIEPTTTTTTTLSPTTTTTTSTNTDITIECVTYLCANTNIYAYDPVTNLSIDLFNDGLMYYSVSNTDTKLWAQTDGGYTREYNLSFNPGPIPTYNRLINTGNNVTPIFAIDNVTLIAWNVTSKLVTELDITTNTAVSTTKGSIEVGYEVADVVLTTSGKLILVAVDESDINFVLTRIYQYDYSTWTLEVMLDVTDQLPLFEVSFQTWRSYIIGISQYQGEIYLFSRIINCVGGTSRVYNLDLLTNTLVYTGNDTGFLCANSASSQLICNTVELSPNCQDCIEGTEITIGTQTWSGCNLNVDTYQNGDIIPEVQDPVIWASLTTGAWCHYNNDPANEAIYGKLYNWYAVNDPRGLAPQGWHIPSDNEFTTLANYLGGATYAGGKMKEEGLCHWNSPNTRATNESGFTGLPGGARIYNTGGFSYLKNFGFFWTSTEATEYFTDTAFFYWLLVGAAYLDRSYVSKVTGNSVRLIKGPAGTTTTTSSTSTTTTTLAPTGFNTIYTHFESL
jgi:uncharacterized protein (TIGR02145 family)